MINLLKKLIDQEEAWLNALFGPGGPLEGQQDKYTLEDYPVEHETRPDAFDPNALVITIKNDVRLRLKTPEELAAEKETI